MTSLLQGFDCSVVTTIPLVECQALLAFYDSTSPWSDPGGWLLSDSPCQDWQGVDCNGDGQVYRLFQSDNGLSGSLVDELGDLEALTWLQLNDNQITGSIPSSLERLTNVEWLRLENNELTGTIPSELGSMSSLQYLYLSENLLKGTIPSHLGRLSSLVRLYADGNIFEGSIPSELGLNNRLQSLTLGSNTFVGALPGTFVGLSELSYLHYLESGVCSPTNDQFSLWLAGVDNVYGPMCTESIVSVPTSIPPISSLPTKSPTEPVSNAPTRTPPVTDISATDTPLSVPVPDATSIPQPPPVTLPTRSPISSPVQRPTNLCQGLVSDQANRPLQPLTKPGYLETVVDPSFGTTIRRITDVEGQGLTGPQAVVKPMYNTVQAWNADESLMILYQRSLGHMLRNGYTYEFIRYLDIFPADIEEVFWDFEDPDVFYYAEPYFLSAEEPGQRLVRYSVSTDTVSEIRSFADICGQAGIRGGNDVQTMSWDSDTIGFRCIQEPAQFFGYKISTDTVTPIITSGVGNTFSPWVAPQSTPSGELFILDDAILDQNMNIIRRLNQNSPEHSCMGLFRNGTDGHFTVAFQEGPRGACGPGVLVAHDLTNGACRTLVGTENGYPYPPSNVHMSALSHLNPGWVAVSIIGVANNGQTANAGQDLLDNELLLVNTDDGGTVCRVGHHRSWGRGGVAGYFAEPHVVISPSGTRILFGSDWGGGNSVDSYVVELPDWTGPDAVTALNADSPTPASSSFDRLLLPGLLLLSLPVVL